MATAHHVLHFTMERGPLFFSVFLTVSSEMRSTISTRRPASSVHSPRAGTRPASPPSPPFWPGVHLLLAAEGGVQPPQRLRKRSTVAVPMPSPMSASTSAPSASGFVPGARQPRCRRRSPSDPGAPALKGSPGRASCPESWPYALLPSLRRRPAGMPVVRTCAWRCLPVRHLARIGTVQIPTNADTKILPTKTINTMPVYY